MLNAPDNGAPTYLNTAGTIKLRAKSRSTVLSQAQHKAMLLAVALVAAAGLTACQSKTAEISAASKAEANCLDLLSVGEKAFSKGDAETADNCFKKALFEAEKLGKDNKNVALALNDLALTTAMNKSKTGPVREKLPEAIAYQKRSVEIEEKVYGKDNAYVAYDLNNLGAWYGANEQYKEGAEALERAVKIREKVLGPKNVLLAFSESNLAHNYVKQKRYDEACNLYRKAKEIYLGENKSKEAAQALDEMAGALQDQKKYDQAAAALKEELQIEEKALGKDSLVVAQTLNALATCLLLEDKASDAEPLFARTLEIVKKSGDKEITTQVIQAYGKCLDKLGKKAEAKTLRESLL